MLSRNSIIWSMNNSEPKPNLWKVKENSNIYAPRSKLWCKNGAIVLPSIPMNITDSFPTFHRLFDRLSNRLSKVTDSRNLNRLGHRPPTLTSKNSTDCRLSTMTLTFRKWPTLHITGDQSSKFLSTFGHHEVLACRLWKRYRFVEYVGNIQQ